MGFDDVAEVIEFAPHYEDLPGLPAALPQRRAYLAKEIARITREGAPVLRAILARPGSSMCIDEALAVLRTGYSDDDGATVVRRLLSVPLRLREGVTPPAIDPNGRRTPPNTLVAKLSTAGNGMDTTTVREGISAQKREQLQAQRRMFNTVSITREGTDLPIDEAVIVLRAWGYGIATQIKRSARDRGDVQVTETWLVEEIPTAKPDTKKKTAA